MREKFAKESDEPLTKKQSLEIMRDLASNEYSNVLLDSILFTAIRGLDYEVFLKIGDKLMNILKATPNTIYAIRVLLTTEIEPSSRYGCYVQFGGEHGDVINQIIEEQTKLDKV